ncbi:MAG: phosphatidate cytidylyltransferase, partial [Candidatus Weimeria sp.]
MFWTRLLSGVVLVILALLLIIPGGIVLLISTCVISLIGLFEYYRALDLHKKSAALVGYAFTVLYYLNLFFHFKGLYTVMLIVFMLIALLFFYVLSYPKYDVKQITELFFGPVYVSVLLSYIYQTRMYTHGKYLVWLIFLTAWGCDTCAYCAGRLFGRHKMSPVLSPKKTVEGAIGGVAGAFLLNLI